MLKAAGFAPLWIELDREIRERQIQARKTFRRTLNLFRKGSMRSQSALDRFQQAVDEINILIRELNLLDPSSRFSRQLVNADSELEWIQADLLTSWEKKTDHLAGS